MLKLKTKPALSTHVFYDDTTKLYNQIAQYFSVEFTASKIKHSRRLISSSGGDRRAEDYLGFEVAPNTLNFGHGGYAKTPEELPEYDGEDLVLEHRGQQFPVAEFFFDRLIEGTSIDDVCISYTLSTDTLSDTRTYEERFFISDITINLSKENEAHSQKILENASELGLSPKPNPSLFKKLVRKVEIIETSISREAFLAMTKQYPRLSNTQAPKHCYRPYIPYLRNKYGYPFQLNDVPAFHENPTSVWLQNSRKLMNGYIDYIASNNAKVDYIGVQVDDEELPQTAANPLLFTIEKRNDPRPIYESLSLSGCDYDMALMGIIEEQFCSYFDDVTDGNYIKEIVRRDSELWEELELQNIGDLIQHYAQHSDERLVSAATAVRDSDKVNTESSPCLDCLIQHEGSIVIKTTKEFEHEANLLAFFIAFSRHSHRSGKRSGFFDPISTITILQLDMRFNAKIMPFHRLFRIVRSREIAPFVIAEETNLNEELIVNASLIEATGKNDHYRYLSGMQALDKESSAHAIEFVAKLTSSSHAAE